MRILLFLLLLALPGSAKPARVSIDGLVCGSNFGDQKVNHGHGEFNRSSAAGGVDYADLNSPTHFLTDRNGRIFRLEGKASNVAPGLYSTNYGWIRVTRLRPTGFRAELVK